MTTIRMNAIWAEWNEDHTSVIAWGENQVEWVGGRSLNYSYEDGWTGANPPPVRIFPQPGGIRFDAGDGSVRFISDVVDGTSNTVFFGESTGEAAFSGAVWGITDHGTGREYFVGLDGALPALETFSDGSVRFLFESLSSNALQILAGNRGPGEPILLDGLSNTVQVSEADLFEADDAGYVWRAGLGDDTLRGGAGADEFWGEDQNDRLQGNDGRDSLMGGAGDDYLNGGRHSDLMFGGIGKDRMLGGSGHDRMFGGDPVEADPAGNDDLFGGKGNDSLYGGAGLDVLDGGEGNDLLVLGTGADAIVFAAGSDKDRVADFSVTEGDILQLNDNVTGGLTTGAAVIAAFATVNTSGRVVLDFGGGDVIDITAAAGSSLATLADQILVF